MLVRRGLSGLTGLMCLLGALALAAPAAAIVDKKGEWPAEDKKISLDIDNTPQDEAIKRLAEAAGWSIVVKGLSDDKTSVHVKDQPADKVLSLILADGEWSAQRDGTLISISRNMSQKAVPPMPPLPPLPPSPPDAEVKKEIKIVINGNASADDSNGPKKGEGKDREVVGQNLVIEKDEVVRNVHLVGGTLVIKGIVTGDVEVVGGKVTLESAARVMGDIEAMGGAVLVKTGARLDGDAQIVGGHFEREEGATVLGNVATRIESDDDKEGTMGAMIRELGECTTAGAFLFALGAVLISLFTKRSETLKVEFATRPMRAFALGIAGVIGGIALFCAMCVTLVGIPFAVIGLLLAILAMFAAMTSVLEVIGKALIGHKTQNEYAHLAFGCGLFALAMAIPVVDDLAKLVLGLVSIGTLVATRGAGLIPQRKTSQSSDAHPYRSAEAV